MVADCGGTSCEWRLITEKHIEELPSTKGYNPTSESAEILKQSVLSAASLVNVIRHVDEVFYYGAGCASEVAKSRVAETLRSLFENAHVVVATDLWGSVRAVYQGKPVICGILGTGSNSCRFDGEQLSFCVSSLGFILGDEGSGNHIGRLLLRAYFYEEMPVELRDIFESVYDLRLDHVLEGVYQQSGAAGFLANYTRFAADHIQHPFINKLVSGSMAAFLQHFVVPFADHHEIELGMVGSVAHYFRDILQKEAELKDIKLGKVLQRPIDHLAEYHLPV